MTTLEHSLTKKETHIHTHTSNYSMNSILPLSKCQVVALNQNVELDTNKAEKQEYGDEVDLEREENSTVLLVVVWWRRLYTAWLIRHTHKL